MRLRAWNAFASNNSGSYTIVGRFTDKATANRVAEELAALVAAHEQWFAADDDAPGQLSPLEQFAAAEGLHTSRGTGRDGDWPAHGPAPEVLAVGAQVVLYVDYTVTMPPLFGELMYHRDGRVDVELDHTHEPLLWIHEIGWPWQGRDPQLVEAGKVRLLDALFAADGPLQTGVQISAPASWTDGGGVGHADLALAAVWCEPLVALAQVRQLVASVGATVRLRVMETTRPRDPAGLFRPCWPWPTENLVDLVLEQVGDQPQAVVEQIAATVLQQHPGYPGPMDVAAGMVSSCPTTLAWALPRLRAQACAKELERAGATVQLVDHEYPEHILAPPIT